MTAAGPSAGKPRPDSAGLALTLRLIVLAALAVPARPGDAAGVAALDQHRLDRAASEPEQWFTGGRDGGGTYYSPLTQINADTVAGLGFAWDDKLGTTRGLEATPLVIDGVMYAVGNWGRVYALDAASGKFLWTYDPQVDGQWGRYACCDAVNRGLAVWKGVVYAGALDGWLHAIDAATGKRLWKVDTLVGRGPLTPYTLPGAPLIAADAVIIGNAGADFAGVRGYVTAYDLATGRQKWRFYTVPRNPAEGAQDQPHLIAAVKTWDPRHRWDAGGGGTVWDGMAYDPSLRLLYIGTANGSPYNIREDGRHGGDDLYVASIIAIHADSGKLAWYFQTVPGDRWDLDSTQKMILADLTLGGRLRHVLMQAPKNGFFYVLDRATGELLSAKNYVFVNWTAGLDPKTGRPTENPAADYGSSPKLIFPSLAGGHGWPPMAYNPGTGLVYIPVLDMPMVLVDTTHRPAGLLEGNFNVWSSPPEVYDPAAVRSLLGPLPPLAELARTAGAPAAARASLRAWDPKAGRIVWDQPFPDGNSAGVMTSAGGLVFQGDPQGVLKVYAAGTGRLLKRIELGSSIMAAPMTYSVRGQQYVAVMAGYGGAAMFGPFPPDTAAFKYGNEGRIIALKLGGPAPVLPPPVIDPPFTAFTSAGAQPRATSAQLHQGEILYNRFCGRCHVFGRSVLPDLRRMSPETRAIFYRIVLDGAYVPKGMGRWDDVLSHADAAAIYAYVSNQAQIAFDSSAVRSN